MGAGSPPGRCCASSAPAALPPPRRGAFISRRKAPCSSTPTPTITRWSSAAAISPNSIKIDHLIVNNANTGPNAGGLQLNYVLSSEIFAVADSAGGAAGIALEQTQISKLSGAGSASAKGGAALLIEDGYSFANTISAMDLEVAPTCLVVASSKAVHNTFISPYMACATAVEATAGDTTQLVNPLFGGNVRRRFAAAVGIEATP
jgi:hypothetical protein